MSPFNLEMPLSAEKHKERSHVLATLWSWHLKRLSCSTGSEAVALIGEVAVRWYFFRDETQVLYPMRMCAEKGKNCLVGNSRHIHVSECRQA
jgi:hypothetical protein